MSEVPLYKDVGGRSMTMIGPCRTPLPVYRRDPAERSPFSSNPSGASKFFRKTDPEVQGYLAYKKPPPP